MKPFALIRNSAAAATLVTGLAGTAVPAHADFKLCNNTDSRVGVAVGYRNQQGWTSEGWWNAGPQSCVTLLKGSLTARYYYIYAVDFDKGGTWGGKSKLCTQDKLFTIRGIEECVERGFQQTGFLEVDTKEEQDWTVSLSGPPPQPQTGG